MAEHFYYSIASGSSGNCGLYVSDGTAVLIDVGVSLRKLTAALAAFDMKPGELDALIITHDLRCSSKRPRCRFSSRAARRRR